MTATVLSTWLGEAGAAMVRKHSPPLRTPAVFALVAAADLLTHAEHIAAGDEWQHRTTRLCETLRAWGRSCDVETRAGRGLPEWPRWREIQRSPAELAVWFWSGEKGSAEVERLAEDVGEWAQQWTAMQEPELVMT